MQRSKPLSDQKVPVIATIITLVAVITMCYLGFWQMDRAKQKTTRLAEIQAKQAEQVITLNQLLSLQTDPRDIKFSAQGHLLKNKVFLLDNKIESGKVGYQVLVPLETDFGLLLVNFGWVAAGLYRTQLPEIELPSGLIELSGLSMVPSVNPMVSETASVKDSHPIVIQAIDLVFLSQFTPTSLLPIVMQLDPQHAAGFVRNWQPVVMAPSKHYAYAVQWFALALACVLIYVVALRKRKS